MLLFAIEQASFVGFLVTCVLGLSGFVVWLVKRILSITRECSETMKDVKNAVANNTIAVKDNTAAIQQFQTTMITLNHK